MNKQEVMELIKSRRSVRAYKAEQIKAEELDYVLNNNTHKFHRPSCSSIEDIKPSNREDYIGSREALIERGYVACKRCTP